MVYHSKVAVILLICWSCQQLSALLNILQRAGFMGKNNPYTHAMPLGSNRIGGSK